MKRNVPFYFVVGVVLLMFMSAVDAILTLLHLQKGGEEVMPTMRWALTHGDMVFIALKMTLTAMGAIVISKWHDRIMSKVGLTGLLLGYVWLIIYHTYLVVEHW